MYNKNSRSEEGLFANPGGKIKTAAWVLFVLGVIGSIVLAIVYGRKYYILGGDFDFWHFLWILAVGLIVSYVNALLIYGFGELVESSAATGEEVRRMTRRTEKKPDIGIQPEEMRNWNAPVQPEGQRTRGEAEAGRPADPEAEREKEMQERKMQADALWNDMTLADQLRYALQFFTTEGGARDYLRRILPAPSPEDGEAVSRILEAPAGALRTAIEEYLNTL